MNQDNVNPKANKHFTSGMTVLRGEKWRSAREMITPTFTTGHLKAAHIHVQHSAQDLIQYIEKMDKLDVDVKVLLIKYTAEVLGRVGCGILPQVLSQPEDNEYYKQVSILTGGGEPNVATMIKFILFTVPKISYWLNIPLVGPVSH